MRSALITGITGQDGSYLAEQLLDRGYEVHGVVRRSSSLNNGRLDHLRRDPGRNGERLRLHHGDVCDSSRLAKIADQVRPDEVYHLGAQSHVRLSFEMPEYTMDTIAVGTVRVLEAIREACPEARVYNASTSEMFGLAPAPQRESTSFHPRSPYAAAKLVAHWTAVNYRESYGMFCCNGILFNHESPRRGESFVTRKITRGLARIQAGLQDTLCLGNLDARRDWGYAPDYTNVMWQMLQQPEPDDYVVATGEAHSVREFLDEAAAFLDLDWERFVEIDVQEFRPAEPDALYGDASKARDRLGWASTVTFSELVQIMVEADVKLLEGQLVA